MLGLSAHLGLTGFEFLALNTFVAENMDCHIHFLFCIVHVCGCVCVRPSAHLGWTGLINLLSSFVSLFRSCIHALFSFQISSVHPSGPDRTSTRPCRQADAMEHGYIRALLQRCQWDLGTVGPWCSFCKPSNLHASLLRRNSKHQRRRTK